MVASHLLLLWSVREETRRPHTQGHSRGTLRLHSHKETAHEDDMSERKVQEGHLTSVQQLYAKAREGALSLRPQKVPPDSGTGQNPLTP